MKNTCTLFILFSVLVISTTLISCVSTGSNNNDLDQKKSQNKTLFLEIDKPSFISEDTLYGNFVFEVNKFILFRFTVVGVSSYGVRGPPSPAPEVYARITPDIKNWIKQRAKNAQDSICSTILWTPLYGGWTT